MYFSLDKLNPVVSTKNTPAKPGHSYVCEILSLYVVTAKYEVKNFFQVEKGNRSHKSCNS